MSRIRLDQIANMPAAIQAQIYPNGVSAPAPEAESPPEAAESPVLAVPEPSALDQTPVYLPAHLIRHILENWGAAFYAAQTETQRRKVVQNCVLALARREANPNSIP